MFLCKWNILFLGGWNTKRQLRKLAIGELLSWPSSRSSTFWFIIIVLKMLRAKWSISILGIFRDLWSLTTMLGTDLCRFGGKTLVLRHLLSRNRLSYLHLSVKYIHLLKKTLTVTCLWTSATSGLKSCDCCVSAKLTKIFHCTWGILSYAIQRCVKYFCVAPPRIWRRQNLEVADWPESQQAMRRKMTPSWHFCPFWRSCHSSSSRLAQ